MILLVNYVIIVFIQIKEYLVNKNYNFKRSEIIIEKIYHIFFNII